MVIHRRRRRCDAEAGGRPCSELALVCHSGGAYPGARHSLDTRPRQIAARSRRSLLFVFGFSGSGREIARVSVSGCAAWAPGLRPTTTSHPRYGLDCFLLSVSRCSARGLEVTIIVVTFGAAARAFPARPWRRPSHRGHRRRARLRRAVERIPRSALAVVVGTLLSAFGTSGAVEGNRNAWPGSDLSIIALAAWYFLASRLLHHVAPSASRTRKSEVNHVAFLAAPRKTRAHSLARPFVTSGTGYHRERLDRCRGVAAIICDLGAAHRGRASWWIPP